MAFAGQEGFTGVQIAVGGELVPDVSDDKLAAIKRTIESAGLTVVALGGPGNHFDPKFQQRFVNSIELAGRMGLSFIGASSGAVAGEPLEKQVQAIVKLYETMYFPACEKHKVRILWEPHVNPYNIATSPVGFSALLNAFKDSPHVGIQMDPSHLAWQMIDPIEATREFADKIFNVHLKDTEILWPLVRKGGIQPVDNKKWWRFRLPGSGMIDWKGFFTALAEAGYSGGLNIENEDQFYYPNYEGADFTDAFKEGFHVAHAYVRSLSRNRRGDKFLRTRASKRSLNLRLHYFVLSLVCDPTRREVEVQVQSHWLEVRIMRTFLLLPIACLFLVGCRTDETPRAQVDDLQITTQLKTKLASDIGLSSITNISINSTNGVVTLSGMVDSPDIKSKAESIAKAVPKVVRVVDNLQIAAKPQQGSLNDVSHSRPTSVKI